eukprot:CAMPEP_0197658560 /NCGR_PEP_ID=MMETSP1338-20131121/45308_1 /TAXON_ID=43686 ORGANISM="Pelagodinium beii, Strain RCC1491" /NCGR_SAMPLE_ID=MMETSP1338 /ASSEMBLY_ACC=CAM_ASM_000754 /LENGTH=171 /DNA_ID=CAMNT_0043235167 /DNA_START=52 /DNA_END=567 /DNA_ORIENTATION=+
MARRHAGGPLLLAFAVLALCGAPAFYSARAFSASVWQRRSLAAAITAQVLLPSPARAGDRDRETMIRNSRRQFLPVILENYKRLKAEGEITEKYANGKNAKKFINALTGWGSIQRMSEAPDKISRKLAKDTSAIEKAIAAQDYATTMSLLDQYKEDVPQLGSATWEWTDQA